MRTTLAILGSLLTFCAVRAQDPVDAKFQDTIRPFVQAHCGSCHGKEKPKGDVDLSGYATVEAVARNHRQWVAVREQLQTNAMPPEKAKQPTAEERKAVIAWIDAMLLSEAKKNAGDPGPVPPRRLNNAEYDNTIRDLIGHDIRPTREFPVDPANEAGFDNSAESLSMSPALLRKYMEAARFTADHLVLKPEGFGFAPHPVLTDTDRDKYGVNLIMAFYKRQPVKLEQYFFAAWKYKHRATLGKPAATLADIAREDGISLKYLETLWPILTETPDVVGPLAALRHLFEAIPNRRAEEGPKWDCDKMATFVNDLRAKLVTEVKNLTSPSVHNGSQSLVLWKNGQQAANRRKYTGGALEIKHHGLPENSPAAADMAVPPGKDWAAKYEASFERFCSVFPDAFFITERARPYLDQKSEKKLGGRLLSAGFHSMTGYYRDDSPLYDLILDEAGQRELDALWTEFDFTTGAPMRQYTSFVWFDRTDSTYMRGAEFDFARAEDKDVTTEPMIKRLAEVYLAKTAGKGASETAQQAIKDYFTTINKQIRRVEDGRKAAEASHIAALPGFAEKAYRRPLTKAERDDVVRFYAELKAKDGLTHEEAVRDTVVSILMSPHFCYRVDRALGDVSKPIQPLTDNALANRLSYYLWSSMPDAELLKLAAAGELHKPEVLKAQTKRMLKDPKVRGLTVDFGGNWLDFRRFEEHNAVDRGRFKSFDNDLRQAMFEEPVRFFIDIAQRDAPITDFIEARHTFVNSALAAHYFGEKQGNEPNDNWIRMVGWFGERGGLLGMPIFMTKNSPGLRTSPVKRGYWVVRRLLGEHIPAPPNDVPELPADEAKLGEKTLRQTLALHRENKACAGCHDKFDSIGLAFEGYGPIGEKRAKDLGGRPVETKAVFPGGQEGDGIEGLRNYILANRKDDFVDNLCRKMLAYALGRGLLLSDEELVRQMKTKLAANEMRFGTMIETIVASPQFLNKRVDSQMGAKP